jgi:hypothetical protein
MTSEREKRRHLVRAWRVHQFGALRDAMTLTDVPDPEPGPGQIVVRVLAAPPGALAPGETPWTASNGWPAATRSAG